MMKFSLLLLLCCSGGTLRAQQFVERVYLKDSVTIYEGFIVAQAPAQYVRIYRFREKDTLHVEMSNIWKITKEYAPGFGRDTQPGIFSNRYYKSYFVEVFGRGVVYSVNFDMRTARGRRNGWGINAGLGIVGSSYSPGVAVLLPFGGNYLFGQKKDFLEVGAGATYMMLIGNNRLKNTYWGISPLTIEKPEGGIIGNFTFGYRHMPVNKGITWRVTFNPTLLDKELIPLFGAGIGYQFW